MCIANNLPGSEDKDCGPDRTALVRIAAAEEDTAGCRVVDCKNHSFVAAADGDHIRLVRRSSRCWT